MALAVILKSLRILRCDKSLATDLSQALIVSEFQPGKELANYSQGTGNTQNKDYAYLVCQGSVRLLTIDTTLRKEVPIQLQLIKQAFGADHLFNGLSFPYRLVSTGRGSLEQIAVINLRTWLQRLSFFEDYFRQLGVQRQELIFCEAKTKLGSQISHTLQVFLSYLILTLIKVGSLLLEVTPYQEAGFRFTDGKTKNCLGQSKAPVIAQMLSFPEQELDAKAERDSLPNESPKQYWRLAAGLAPKRLWLQNQIYDHQIYQPREYKYSNLAAADQPPVSQIYPQIDSSQFKWEAKNVVWIDDFLSFASFGIELSALCQYCFDLTFLSKIRSEILFENIYFGFHPDEVPKTLKNISFNVRAGQSIGIVGASGSGKATIINFLTGSYHPTSGRILIDGHDISRVYLESLLLLSWVVRQESFRFASTIFNNIILYNHEFSIEQVIVALKLRAHALIQKLSLGYHTPLGKRGIMLAAVQLQKIAIARRLIINPRILTLD